MGDDNSNRNAPSDDAHELMIAAWTLRRTTLLDEPATEAAFNRTADLIRLRLTQAVALFRRAGDPRALATALGRLGHVEEDAGRPDDAVSHYAEAVAVARAATDPMLLAQAVRHLADAHRSAGRLADAEIFYDEALALYAADEEPPALHYANALRTLALLKETQGQTDDAKRLWRHARTLYAGVPVAAGEAECDEHLARLT